MNLEAEQQIDTKCVEFEKLLQAGSSPQIGQFLEGVSDHLQGKLFRELLHLELAYYDSPAHFDASELLEQFPAHAELIRGVVADYREPSPAVPSRLRALSDFQIRREVGRGGMGVVYEATQRSLKRRVALKVVSSELGLSETAVMRFRRETEAAGRLHHTNIIPIYATGRENSIDYYAMEFIDGPSLDQVIKAMQSVASEGEADSSDATVDALATTILKSGSAVAEGSTRQSGADDMPGDLAVRFDDDDYFDQVARMVAGAADALEHAHEHGVVHRDVKPANLLIDSDGQLKITDFGLARMLEQPGMTISGELVGSPLYMSPEQIAVGRVQIDHRTDIYSLGVTLYELLTLRPPFPGRSRDQVILQILAKSPPAPCAIRRSIPRDLETICLKAIEKDPDRRYQNAALLAADLRSYVSRHAIAARRVGPLGRLKRWARQHPSLSLLLGCVACLLVGLGVVLWQAGAAARRSEQEKAISEIDRKIDSALDAAFRGDLKRAITSVDEAEAIAATRLDEPGRERLWSLLIPGIVSLYGNYGASKGTDPGAVVYFEKAHGLDSKDVSAHALLCVAYLWSGQWADYESAVASLKNVPTPQDPTERFFLGQALLWSDSGKAVDLIRTVRQDPYWANSPVVSVMYAEALGHHAWHENSSELAEESVAEARRAMMIVDDLPGPVAISNWAHMVYVSIRKCANQPADDLIRQSRQYATKLNDPKYRDLVIGYPCRAWFYDALEEEGNATAIGLLRECLDTHGSTGWIAGMYAAEMYRFGRSAEALEVLNRIEPARRDALVHAARAFLIFDTEGQDGLHEISAICQILQTHAREGDGQAAVALVTTLLLTGQVDVATRTSRQFRRLTPPVGPEYLSLLDEATPEAGLSRFASERMNDCLARYMIGLHYLGSGTQEGVAKARDVLHPAVKAGGLMINPQLHWIRAVYERAGDQTM